ncbi:hypothetical protein McpSp1_01380 [Methanocorpusculaceae archaeon Sp1]|nr:hypothetical protein [Methanocorpusculaceae archaeon Sp1]
MSAKGDMYYAWANQSACPIKGECGGAVTAILKYMLDNKVVDAVLTVKKGRDVYEAVPVLVHSSEELSKTAGSLHCGTVLLPKIIKKYLDGARDMKIAVTCKGCDAKAMYELAKRQQINMDNIFMIGLNCGGSVTPIMARTMIAEKYGLNPNDIVKEEIDKGQFIVITKDGEHKGISIDELEEHGLGRRANCQRCETKIPRQADIACGNWGVIGEKAGKTTFVEICSEKGAAVFDAAVKSGVLQTSAPEAKGLEVRGKIENVMMKMGKKNQEKQFAALGEGSTRLSYIMAESSRCIKCYGCIENCPICYCVECSTKKPHLVRPGVIPPDFMFQMIRFAHIADSCVNCGQCSELCPMNIPNSLFMHAQQVELEKMFGHKPGYDMTMPVLSFAEEMEERERLHATGSDMIFENVFKE